MTRKPALLLLPGVRILVREETILGKKLARASSSAIALVKAFSAVTAWDLTAFEPLSVRLSSMTRTASPSAGIFGVAVKACLPLLVLDASVTSSAMHLKASAWSSSEVAAMPFSAEEGLARNVKRIRSCPDRAGSSPPPHPVHRSADTHSRQSSSARTGTCRESRRT